jgi:NADH-quinone oxidoreductase subunit J
MLETILFYTFAALTAGSAFGVAFSATLRQAAIALILTFCGIAALFFVLRAELLAAMQLLLFVGGITVMLLMGTFTTGGVRTLNATRRGIAVALLAAGVIALPLITILIRAPWHARNQIVPAPGAERIGQALVDSHGPDAYLIPLELLSIVLLTVIVGASYLARPRRPAAPAGPPHVETLAPSPMLPRPDRARSAGRGTRP